MKTQPSQTRGHMRRAATSVLLAVAAGVVTVAYATVGDAATAATTQTGSTPTSSTSDTPTAETDATSLPDPVPTSITSAPPPGSCIDSDGKTVGTLPGQTECPEPIPVGPCQAINPDECLPTYRFEGEFVSEALAGESGGPAAGHPPASERHASLSFTG